jgi:hypothetical protein
MRYRITGSVYLVARFDEMVEARLNDVCLVNSYADELVQG